MIRLLFIIFISIFIQSCSWFQKQPSGVIQISGTFIYEDLSLDDSVPVIVYSFKGKNERSFLGYLPVKEVVKGFFDNKKSIPFKGEFKGEVVYDRLNRIDFLKIKEMDSQFFDLEIKGKDIN